MLGLVSRIRVIFRVTVQVRAAGKVSVNFPSMFRVR